MARVVQTKRWDPTVTGQLGTRWASTLAGNLPLLVTWRTVRWVLVRPAALAGVAFAGVVVYSGAPLWLGVGVAVAMWAAWAVRVPVRLAARPSRDGPWFRRSLTALGAYWRLTRRWPTAATAAGLTFGGRDGEPLRLLHVRTTPTGLAAVVANGAVGVTTDDVARDAERIAGAIRGCRSVVATPGRTPEFTRLDFNWADPLEQVVPPTRLQLPSSGHLTFGVTETGAAATIDYRKSLLIVGQSGSGKSGTLWALLASALAVGVPIRLRVIDPAGGVELHHLRDSPFVVDYAERVSDVPALLKRSDDALEARLAAMAGKSRLHVPTEAEPLDVIVIDEMLLMLDILKGGTNTHLGKRLVMGRKGACTVWGLTQASQIDTLGQVRRLFVQKLVLATDNRAMTDAVLGDGAESMGARASKIRPSTPGIGYAQLEGTPGFPRFRTAWIADDLARVISRGYLPDGIPQADEVTGRENRPHVLYQWDDPDGQPLYVGITVDGVRRAGEHLGTEAKAALRRPGVTMRIVEEFTEASCADALAEGRTVRDVAEEVERERIKALRPPLNIAHNGTPRGRKRIAQRAS